MLRTISGLVVLNVASQGIAVAALPFLTAFYSPEDFNSLAAFTAIATIGMAIAAFRLELNIPIVEDAEDANTLYWLALAIVVLVTGLALTLIALAGPSVRHEAGLGQALWLVPLAIFFGGLQSIALHKVVRHKGFTFTGVTRIVQTVLGIATQLLAGYLAFAHLGLVAGFLVNTAVGALLLIGSDMGRPRRLPTLAQVRRLWIHFKQRGAYSTADALMNTGGVQVPLFIISTFGNGSAGGLLFMAIRLFYTPTTIISSAFGKVYHAEIGMRHREKAIALATERFLHLLVRFGGALVIGGAMLGPILVEKFLPQRWSATGDMLRLIAPWVLLQLLTSPISTLMYATGGEKALLRLNSLGLVLRVGAVIAGLAFAPSYAPACFAISSAAFYAACLASFARRAELDRRAVFRIFQGNWIWLASVALGSYIVGEGVRVFS